MPNILNLSYTPSGIGVVSEEVYQEAIDWQRAGMICASLRTLCCRLRRS